MIYYINKIIKLYDKWGPKNIFLTSKSTKTLVNSDFRWFSWIFMTLIIFLLRVSRNLLRDIKYMSIAKCFFRLHNVMSFMIFHTEIIIHVLRPNSLIHWLFNKRLQNCVWFRKSAFVIWMLLYDRESWL